MLDVKLTTFLKVTETKNFTRAAEALALTQPAVSQHIKQLESELGVKLFIRAENGLKLSRDGEIVYKYAQRLHSVYQNMLQALVDERTNTTHLTIGITHTAESNAIAEVLAKFSAAHGGMRITMITDTINNLYSKLKTYELDLAIAEGTVPASGFNSLLLDTDCLVLAVANNHPLAKKSMVTINELKHEKMIIRLPDSGTRNLFVSHLESNNMSINDFNVVLEVDNVATIKELIRHGFGVSILAKSVCLNEIRKGKLTALPVENLSMMRQINLIYHKSFENIALLRDLVKTYNDTMQVYNSAT